MASTGILFAMAIVAAATISPALATEFVVGDEKGWTKNFDYKAWAQGKEFHVGDQLVFKYPQGVHNVYRVNGTAFQMCAPPATVEPLTTGSDVITLTTTGKKWYICGVRSHCQSGNQKLTITVLQQVGTTAPAHSTASGIVLCKYFAWMIAEFGVLMAIIV